MSAGDAFWWLFLGCGSIIMIVGSACLIAWCVMNTYRECRALLHAHEAAETSGPVAWQSERMKLLRELETVNKLYQEMASRSLSESAEHVESSRDGRLSDLMDQVRRLKNQNSQLRDELCHMKMQNVAGRS